MKRQGVKWWTCRTSWRSSWCSWTRTRQPPRQRCWRWRRKWTPCWIAVAAPSCIVTQECIGRLNAQQRWSVDGNLFPTKPLWLGSLWRLGPTKSKHASPFLKRLGFIVQRGLQVTANHKVPEPSKILTRGWQILLQKGLLIGFFNQPVRQFTFSLGVIGSTECEVQMVGRKRTQAKFHVPGWLLGCNNHWPIESHSHMSCHKSHPCFLKVFVALIQGV